MGPTPPPNIIRRRKDMSYIPRISPALGPKPTKIEVKEKEMGIIPKDPPPSLKTITTSKYSESTKRFLRDCKSGEEIKVLKDETYHCKYCDQISDIVVSKGKSRTCIYIVSILMKTYMQMNLSNFIEIYY